MNIPRFLNDLKSSIPPSNQTPIPPALVHAVQLVGLVFCGDDTLRREEPRKLAAVLQALAADMDPNRIIHILQAEVLVSYYLFHQNRRLEANYHAAAAVSIAVACNLHKIRSATWMFPQAGTAAGQQLQLFPPADDVEEGERIRAFWTVFALDRCWTVWAQSPSVFVTAPTAMTQVDTPWPLEMSQYEQVRPCTLTKTAFISGAHAWWLPQPFAMPQGNTSAMTVQNFVDGLTAETPEQSLLALRSKAAVFFEKAYHLAERWNPGTWLSIIPRSFSAARSAAGLTCAAASVAFQNEFHTLDTRIDAFKNVVELYSAQFAQLSAHRQRGLLLTRTLLCCATIQLYGRTNTDWNNEESKVIRAAITAADATGGINFARLAYVDPVLGVRVALCCPLSRCPETNLCARCSGPW